MKVLSSTQSAVADDDSFETLLARQKERLQSAPHVAENRPNGELQMSWKLDSSKNKKSKADSSKKDMQTQRRSASKNVFRKMRK
jgi:hypothetical protein